MKQEINFAKSADRRNSRLLVILIAITALGLVLVSPAFADSTDPLDQWSIRSPLPTGNNLASIDYGNGIFVAVGYSGTISTSPDGVNWASRTSGTPNHLHGISYGNNTFVAVGGNGTILSSSDGVAWTSRTAGTTNTLLGVSYSNDTFVAVGASGTILTSPDGLTWTGQTSGTTQSLNGASYGNDTFVVVGANGTILTSADNVNWTSRNSGTTNALFEASYGNHIFVVVGGNGTILTSADGVSWTSRNSGIPQYLFGIGYDNNIFVAVGAGGKIATSLDGLTWTEQTSGTTQGLEMVGYGNGTFVTVGAAGTLLTSLDGATWISRTSGTIKNLYGTSYGNNTFVAVGAAGTILTSANGVTWTSQDPGSTNTLYGVSYGNNTFVAVGAGGTILASADGVTWTGQDSGSTNTLYGVSYGNNTFVAVGAGSSGRASSPAPILTSPDGVTWTSRTSDTYTYLRGISYGNETFVIVGLSGTIFTSPNGGTWTQQTPGTTKNLQMVSYGSNTFVAVGASGTILTSPDGVTWTSRISEAAQQLNGVSYGHDTFVAVGAAGTILTSPDGVTWTSRIFDDPKQFNGVSYGQNTFVAIGDFGRIVQSGALPFVYTVTYAGNGSTVGSVPTDANSYPQGATVTVLDNSGQLMRAGYTFAGWNTAADGSGTGYAAGTTFSMGTGAVTLYAAWNAVAVAPSIASQPASVTRDSGTTAIFTVAATAADGGTLSYQWQRSTDAGAIWAELPGAISASYTTGVLGVADDGTSYRCIVTNTKQGTTATASSNVATLTVNPVQKATSAGNRSTGGSEAAVEVLVNGKTETVAVATTTKVDDTIVTTVAVDDEKIGEKLQQEGNHAVVTIRVQNDAKVMVGILNGQTVKKMENKEAVLEIKTEQVTYTLPAAQINIDTVSEQMGKQVELKDIAVNVKISEPARETVKIVEDTANKNNYQLLVRPVEFAITCSSGNQTVEVLKFNTYVERTIAIPEDIDPTRITTGIVLNPDGTFSHVPTVITIINGEYYAKINSLTNSTYSVIWNPKTFKDVEQHWAAAAVNDMGSRLVVSGVGIDKFDPDRDITRAELAAIVVKALGLTRPRTETDTFNDVPQSAWYYDAVSTAHEYGIVSGYGNGKFGPNDKTTREQAMLMIARAMEITGLNAEFSVDEINGLLADFDDAAKSADYARNSIAACLKAEIVLGRHSNLIAPKDYVTRAEVTVMVRRLLQKSNLI